MDYLQCGLDSGCDDEHQISNFLYHLLVLFMLFMCALNNYAKLFTRYIMYKYKKYYFHLFPAKIERLYFKKRFLQKKEDVFLWKSCFRLVILQIQ